MVALLYWNWHGEDAAWQWTLCITEICYTASWNNQCVYMCQPGGTKRKAGKTLFKIDAFHKPIEPNISLGSNCPVLFSKCKYIISSVLWIVVTSLLESQGAVSISDLVLVFWNSCRLSWTWHKCKGLVLFLLIGKTTASDRKNGPKLVRDGMQEQQVVV